VDTAVDIDSHNEKPDLGPGFYPALVQVAARSRLRRVPMALTTSFLARAGEAGAEGATGGVGELYRRRSAIVTLCSPPHHQDWGRAGTAGNRFARDEKELGPELGETITRRTAS
jgi:hypothetical protein